MSEKKREADLEVSSAGFMKGIGRKECRQEHE